MLRKDEGLKIDIKTLTGFLFGGTFVCGDSIARFRSFEVTANR